MRELGQLYKALADETRLAMLALLVRREELCVCDFVDVMAITQSKASRHLRYLLNTGLVQDRREAVWIFYRVAEPLDEARREVIASVHRLTENATTKKLLKALDRWQANRQCGTTHTCKR
ncbi:MAG TPA: metalloregulator ArsR/SmtB family transcription factor [bacterium]|nr:metalloregulator ArsR/SmtB family transcription factor [bacterium]